MFDPHLDRMGNSVRPNRKKKMEPPPGPGHYHENIVRGLLPSTHITWPIVAWLCTQRHCPLKCAGTDMDVLYAAVQHDRQDEPVLVSSSFFMSNVARIRGPDPELLPPGPAYYNPDNVSKKSFHLNARQRWL